MHLSIVPTIFWLVKCPGALLPSPGQRWLSSFSILSVATGTSWWSHSTTGSWYSRRSRCTRSSWCARVPAGPCKQGWDVWHEFTFHVNGKTKTKEKEKTIKIETLMTYSARKNNTSAVFFAVVSRNCLKKKMKHYSVVLNWSSFLKEIAGKWQLLSLLEFLPSWYACTIPRHRQRSTSNMVSENVELRKTNEYE